ncbi:hypothetical protein F5Y08DRAFT_349161 [Xylaria arbuscula]|nr:hypothetical protein F5Y08DRAFT_349161 [Xylaria arbuscula]
MRGSLVTSLADSDGVWDVRASAALIRVSGHPVRATWLGSIRPPFLACRIPCGFHHGLPLVPNGPWSARRPFLLNCFGKIAQERAGFQGPQAPSPRPTRHQA